MKLESLFKNSIVHDHLYIYNETIYHPLTDMTYPHHRDQPARSGKTGDSPLAGKQLSPCRTSSGVTLEPVLFTIVSYTVISETF